jgi:DNA processing protein
VEAGDRSGALITAAFALDYNREVLACTTGPENPAGSGVRAMLREGAALVVDPDDTAAALVDLANRHGYALPEPVRAGAPPTAEPEAELAQVFNAVLESSTVDDIVAATGLGAGRVAGDLAALELDGFVVNEGGGRYSRVTS